MLIYPPEWNSQKYWIDRYSGIIRWTKDHKTRTGFLLLFGFLFVQYLFLPFNSLHRLQTVNPAVTALMNQRMKEAATKGKKYSITQKWIPYAKITTHLPSAIVCGEDGLFYEHAGVDWFEVGESIEQNFEAKKTVRGASTISQQLVKNLFLSTSKNPLRKFNELIITIRMERMLSKRRIMECYMNLIEWGDGIFGCEAAARKYFGKSASSLSMMEAARLAAVIPNPIRFHPVHSGAYISTRASIIAQRMVTWGYEAAPLSPPEPAEQPLDEVSPKEEKKPE